MDVSYVPYGAASWTKACALPGVSGEIQDPCMPPLRVANVKEVEAAACNEKMLKPPCAGRLYLYRIYSGLPK